MSQDARTEQIHRYWDERALEYGTEMRASTADVLAKRLEMTALLAEVDRRAAEKNGTLRVLDVGCGNGLLALAIAERYEAEVTGVDLSEEMVARANEAQAEQGDALKGACRFLRCGALELLERIDAGSVDVVVTERCLINLTSVDEQVAALETIRTVLAPGGVYLMCECTQLGLDRVNDVREEFDLARIQPPWHNLYLDESKILPAAEGLFELERVEHFASTYYLLSRVMNAKLTPEGEDPDYLSPVNLIAADLPALGDYAPQRLFVLRKP